MKDLMQLGLGALAIYGIIIVKVLAVCAIFGLIQS